MAKKLSKDSLGDRMKNYEYVTRNSLINNLPVIVRLDGKAFHTFTRGFEKPVDNVLSSCMISTMQSLCENIQGCKLGYTQSDEISLFLCDYDTIKSEPFLKYNIQKIVSIIPSMATNYFNSSLLTFIASTDNEKTKSFLRNKMFRASFDCRAFNLPKDEVTNYIIWRQNDASRNSIQAYGQKYLGHKCIAGLKSDEVQYKLFTEKGINWNDEPIYIKRGVSCKKDYKTNKWTNDYEMPIVSKCRSYVDNLVIGYSDYFDYKLEEYKVGSELDEQFIYVNNILNKGLNIIHISDYNNKLDKPTKNYIVYKYLSGRMIIDKINIEDYE